MPEGQFSLNISLTIYKTKTPQKNEIQNEILIPKKTPNVTNINNESHKKRLVLEEPTKIVKNQVDT